MVCRIYETFYGKELPIPTHFLTEMLKLILKENSSHFNGENQLQTHGTAMGTKVAISFANICMAEVKTDVINQSPNIPLIWKRYIDDIFSLWNTKKEPINNFTELANRFHPSIRFTAEISHTEITFMETCLYKGDRLKKNSSLHVRTHFKPIETFQYTPFDSCHPPGVRKGFLELTLERRNLTNTWHYSNKDYNTGLSR